ncbi:piggyBac transposable element-derived protein 4 [Trichonephila inaurata madagascariensis]|uniref:PiggyBac transposable element-derived protein 4 n=1 Tax=Trichonephila inaurata madagascariensis TaxID=2747483 RepID=A0A8X6MH49_9ARAC|nr:piggyBac transposable element-derived protein 4 [Trichonephila inaurata madagascariensis]
MHDYNNTMGGVDKVDEHRTNYPVARKRGKKYHQKIFFHLPDQALYNSFIMYNSAGGEKNNMNYRVAVVEQNKPNVQIPGPGCPSVSLLCLTGRYFPEHIPPKGKNSSSTSV